MVQFYTEDETVKAVKKLISRKMFHLAKITLHEGLKTFTDSKMLRFLSGHIAGETRDFNTASRIFEELLEEDPGQVELLNAIAIAYGAAGKVDEAIEFTWQVIKKTGRKMQGVLSIADIYEKNNRVDDAEEVLQQLTDEQCSTPNYHAIRTRILIAKKEYAKAIDFILSTKDIEDSSEDFKIVSHFMLSKAYDRLGEYDKAWEAATHAHDLDETSFDEYQFFAQFEDMRDFMTKEIFEALPEGPKTSFEPLFIVGNPRSGTSLLEQIMSMHPDIENGGEMSVGMAMQIEVSSLTDSFHSWPTNLIDLRSTDAEVICKEYCDATDYFSGGKKVVSNKALNLPTQVGFLLKILPSSKAIMLHRHPLDNAVSCYTSNLLSAGHPYTNSLNSLGRAWVERKKMAEMWLELLQIPVMELHYENLVADQRGETERIIEFLDLPWQEDCMEFHKSKHVARTISYDQVNRKMYSSSSGRWKNYEKHLGPVMDAVSDYI